MKSITCCFTGHRKLPREKIEHVIKRLDYEIDKLISQGVTNYISGGALGFDQIAASLIIAKKEMGRDIRLIFALPCKNQDEFWGADQKRLYRSLLAEADEVIYVSEEYVDSCMKKRNRYMVDKSAYCISARLHEGNRIFTSILTMGIFNSDAKDNYSLNYKLLTELIEQYATSEPELFFWFIRNVLNKVILLPITADSQDTALTIFSTLNDRGLALSDADIFKAKIYNRLDTVEKTHFIEQWQQLDEDASNANESIQKLFYYYMFYLRALEDDRNTTTPGIRKYYSRNKFEQLYKSGVLDNLKKVLNLWILVNNRVEIENEPWSNNIEIRQTLDALSSYPNEFWKYPVIIYYLKYSNAENFEELFLTFLCKLLSVLLARYIITPTINAVKRGILNLNAEIIKSSTPRFDFAKVEDLELKEKIKTANRNTVRMILKILAYQQQEVLLPDKWEIEHILPQKWQTSYFPNTSDEEVAELVEHIGNKVPFEKRLNIIASNGYFRKKRESYNKSKIQIVLNLSKQNNDWGMDDIRERDIRVSDILLKLMNEWGFNQAETLIEQQAVPTDEDLRVIEELKRKGFI